MLKGQGVGILASYEVRLIPASFSHIIKKRFLF